MISEPHRRLSSIPSVPLVSERRRKVERSDEKKYREFKLMYNIKKLQKSTSYMLPKEPFRRVVREIAREVSQEDLKWQQSALEALQFSAEDFMTDFFSDSFACAEHAKRITLMSKDLALARRIRGNKDPSNW
jgi:histone H3/H4